MKLPHFPLKFRPAAQAPELLSVRETAWGYVIRSVRPGGVLERPAQRLGAAAVWLAAVGLWLVPAAWLPDPAFAARALGSVTLLAAFYAGFVALTRARGYEVQVDTARRELRIGEVTAKGQAWIRSCARFDEVGEGVWRKTDGGAALRDLCLRLKASGELVPVAVGDEDTLFAVHARLMRDLRPVEERVSSYYLATGKGGGRAAFAPLGPQEVTVRA